MAGHRISHNLCDRSERLRRYLADCLDELLDRLKLAGSRFGYLWRPPLLISPQTPYRFENMKCA